MGGAMVSGGRVVFGLSVGRGPGLAAGEWVEERGAKIKTTSVCLRQEPWSAFGSRTLRERRAVQGGVVTWTPPPHVALFRMVYYIYTYIHTCVLYLLAEEKNNPEKKHENSWGQRFRFGLSLFFIFYFHLSEKWVFSLLVCCSYRACCTQRHGSESLRWKNVILGSFQSNV